MAPPDRHMLFARQIRGTEWGRQMALIAATGWGHESDEHRSIEAGFAAVYGRYLIGKMDRPDNR